MIFSVSGVCWPRWFLCWPLWAGWLLFSRGSAFRGLLLIFKEKSGLKSLKPCRLTHGDALFSSSATMNSIWSFWAYREKPSLKPESSPSLTHPMLWMLLRKPIVNLSCLVLSVYDFLQASDSCFLIISARMFVLREDFIVLCVFWLFVFLLRLRFTVRPL